MVEFIDTSIPKIKKTRRRINSRIPNKNVFRIINAISRNSGNIDQLVKQTRLFLTTRSSLASAAGLFNENSFKCNSTRLTNQYIMGIVDNCSFSKVDSSLPLHPQNQEQTERLSLQNGITNCHTNQDSKFEKSSSSENVCSNTNNQNVIGSFTHNNVSNNNTINNWRGKKSFFHQKRAMVYDPILLEQLISQFRKTHSTGQFVSDTDSSDLSYFHAQVIEECSHNYQLRKRRIFKCWRKCHCKNNIKISKELRNNLIPSSIKNSINNNLLSMRMSYSSDRGFYIIKGMAEIIPFNSTRKKYLICSGSSSSSSNNNLQCNNGQDCIQCTPLISAQSSSLDCILNDNITQVQKNSNNNSTRCCLITPFTSLVNGNSEVSSANHIKLLEPKRPELNSITRSIDAHSTNFGSVDFCIAASNYDNMFLSQSNVELNKSRTYDMQRYNYTRDYSNLNYSVDSFSRSQLMTESQQDLLSTYEENAMNSPLSFCDTKRLDSGLSLHIKDISMLVSDLSTFCQFSKEFRGRTVKKYGETAKRFTRFYSNMTMHVAMIVNMSTMLQQSLQFSND